MKQDVARYACLMSLVICSALSAQRTLIVDRTNATFRTIQAAVDVARSGDIVLVRGTGPYAGASVNTGIHLLGETTPQINGSFKIMGLAAGQHASVKGFRFVNNSVETLLVRNCRGTVHLAGLRIERPAGVFFDRADHVTAADCHSMSAISLRLSNASLVRCTTRTGVSVQFDSRLVAVDCTFRGSDGACFPSGHNKCSSTIGTGLFLDWDSVALLKRVRLIAGTQTTGGCGQCRTYQAIVYGRSTLVHEPTVSYRIYKRSNSSSTNGVIADLQAKGVTPGQSISIAMRSTRAAPFAVFVGEGQKPTGPGFGPWLDPRSAVFLYAGQVNGTHTTRIAVPRTVARGLPVGLQGVLLIQNRIELSTPAFPVLH